MHRKLSIQKKAKSN